MLCIKHAKYRRKKVPRKLAPTARWRCNPIVITIHYKTTQVDIGTIAKNPLTASVGYRTDAKLIWHMRCISDKYQWVQPELVLYTLYGTAQLPKKQNHVQYATLFGHDTTWALFQPKVAVTLTIPNAAICWFVGMSYVEYTINLCVIALGLLIVFCENLNEGVNTEGVGVYLWLIINLAFFKGVYLLLLY